MLTSFGQTKGGQKDETMRQQRLNVGFLRQGTIHLHLNREQEMKGRHRRQEGASLLSAQFEAHRHVLCFITTWV